MFHCPSTQTPIRPHLTYRHRLHTILLLAVCGLPCFFCNFKLDFYFLDHFVRPTGITSGNFILLGAVSMCLIKLRKYLCSQKLRFFFKMRRIMLLGLIFIVSIGSSFSAISGSPVVLVVLVRRL